MLTWSIEKKILDLKYAWKISRNSSNTKTNLFINVTDGVGQGVGEIAPNVRYGETPEVIEKQFQEFLLQNPANLQSIEQLSEVLNRFSFSHALRFGIESAFIHFLCHNRKISVSNFLDILFTKSIPISYSVPIMEIGRMKEFYIQNKLKRFPIIKVKVNADEAFEAIKYLSSFCHQPILVDANEDFEDVEQCIYVFEKLKGKNIEFIEQPMPANMIEESIYLKKHFSFPLFADESITDEADFSKLKLMFDGINVKLMKAGGYLNALRLLKEARANNMKTMIGCMVETTLGISSGMHLCAFADYADLDSFLLIKNEPYNLVREEGGVLIDNLNA